MELPFLHDAEQTLVSYWTEVGRVSHTANGPVEITWEEINAWVQRLHSEQYVEWVEHPLTLRADGQPDERYKRVMTPLMVTQCSLPDWVLQAIKRMSQEYVSEFFNNSANAPCPKEIILDDITEDEKITNANSIEAAFKSIFGIADQVPAV